MYSNEGGIYLHSKLRYFSTSSAYFHNLGGNGGWAGAAQLAAARSTSKERAVLAPTGMAAAHACRAAALLASCVAVTWRSPFLPLLSTAPCVPAGQGLTLQPGSYAHPLSFTGMFGFGEWGLRILVRPHQGETAGHCQEPHTVASCVPALPLPGCQAMRWMEWLLCFPSPPLPCCDLQCTDSSSRPGLLPLTQATPTGFTQHPSARTRPPPPPVPAAAGRA